MRRRSLFPMIAIFMSAALAAALPRAREPRAGTPRFAEVSYTMDLFARAVDAVMRDAGVDRAVLVGHSMGTPVIRQFYRKHPGRTLALVIVDGPLRPFGDKKTMDEFSAPLRGSDYKEAAGRFIDTMFGPMATPELRAEIKNAMLSTPQSVAVSVMEGMADETIWTADEIAAHVLARFLSENGLLKR